LLRDAKVVPRPLAKNYQSFFASFCSQKEVLSFFAAWALPKKKQKNFAPLRAFGRLRGEAP
jgi:hypothetical protein